MPETPKRDAEEGLDPSRFDDLGGLAWSRRVWTVAALRGAHDAFGHASGLRPAHRSHEFRWVEWEGDGSVLYGQGPGYKESPGAGTRLGFHPTDTRVILAAHADGRKRVCANFGFLDFFNAIASAAREGRLTRSNARPLGELLARLAFAEDDARKQGHVLEVEGLATDGEALSYDYDVTGRMGLELDCWWTFAPPAPLLAQAAASVGPVLVSDRTDGRFPVAFEAAFWALHLIGVNEDNLYHHLPEGNRSDRLVRIGRINMALTTLRVLGHCIGMPLAFPPPGWEQEAQRFPAIRSGFPEPCWHHAARAGGRPPNPGMTRAEYEAFLRWTS